jgi:endonuclease YncB( thermonuclease family)
MNQQEARSLLAEYLARCQRRSSAALVAMIGNGECYEVRGSSGVRYQVEVQAVWDDRPDGVVRVIGSIDDGGYRRFFPSHSPSW